MTRIFHITHVSNLNGIIDHGGLACDRQAQALGPICIGHQHIKARRMVRPVPCFPGGTLGDYVPFYFAPRSPMLYSICCGNVQGYVGGQTQVMHLVSSAEAVQTAGLSYVFTEGHAEISFSKFFVKLTDLKKIDWKIMEAKYWRDTDADGDRKRRRQAEFLVHNFFPWNLIHYIGVYNNNVEREVNELLKGSTHKPKVGMERSWYY